MSLSKAYLRNLETTINDCYLAFKNLRSGKPANYIPALAQVNPDYYAVAICTVDGVIISSGDVDQQFSIQSVAKPFLYAAALAQLGESKVLEKVGVEPTGYNFSSIVRLEGGSSRADNPLVNAGAIAVSGLLTCTDKEEEVSVDTIFAPFLDREHLEIDNEIFSSEVATGNRNYSIANLLKFHGIIDGSVHSALDLYFRACSTKVNTRDLAVMAATLANAGVNPITGKRAILESHTTKVLSVMSSCGLYDYSGEFAFFTGLPAKSGVAGDVIAVVPGVMAIALYSPPIDSKGNSLRALQALPYLSEKLNLHVLHPQGWKHKKQQLLPRGEDLVNIVKKTHSGNGYASGDAYLSTLKESNKDNIAVAIYSVDGSELVAGDVELPFSIQAAVNPIVFGYALEERGLGTVLNSVGIEPSGNPFNAIFFQPDTNLPYNPLSNAGAIAVDSLLPGASTSQRFEPLLQLVQKLCCDQEIGVDPEVLAQEKENSNRNEAIAYMLRHFGVIHDIERPLGLYYRQCSIKMNCIQVAKMAATLANGGKSPWSGELIFSEQVVQQILSVMLTCGLYDYSGRFIYDVGIPAKSGISGIIFGVIPSRFGIAVYAPGVDEHGNSIRGTEFLKLLSKLSRLSIYDS